MKYNNFFKILFLFITMNMSSQIINEQFEGMTEVSGNYSPTDWICQMKGYDEWSESNQDEGIDGKALKYESSFNGKDSWVITKQVTLDNTKTYEYLLSAKSIEESYNPSKINLKLTYGTDQTKSTQVNEIISKSSVGFEYELIKGEFSPKISGAFFIGINVKGKCDAFLDNFIIREKKSCQTPTNFTTTSVSDTSLEVTWTGNSTGYTAKITNKDGTYSEEKTITQAQVTFNNLVGNTKYKVTVTGNCTAEDSYVSNVFNTQTKCTPNSNIAYMFKKRVNPFYECWNFVGDIKNVIMSTSYDYFDIKEQTLMVAPILSNIENGDYKVRLKIKAVDYNKNAKIKIGVISDPTSGADFKEVGEITYDNGSDEKEHVIFFDKDALTTAGVSGEKYIAFKNVGTSTSLKIESFYWEKALTKPGCTTITAPENNQEEIQLTEKIEWELNLDARGYKVQVKKDNTVILTKDVNNVLTYTFEEGDLEYNTTYKIDIIAYATDDSECATETRTVKTLVSPNYGGGEETTEHGGYYFANSIADPTKAEVTTTYNWIDPIANNHNSLLASDMENTGSSYSVKRRYKLKNTDLNGFTFEFYDVTKNEFYINENGALYFTNEDSSEPGTKDFNNANDDDLSYIAAVYADYDFSTDSKIYYHSDGNQLVITWYKMQEDNDQEITFQLILNKTDNSIKVQVNTAESNPLIINPISYGLNGSGSCIGLHAGDLSKGTAYKGTLKLTKVQGQYSQDDIDFYGPLFNGVDDLAILFKKKQLACATPKNLATTEITDQTVTVKWNGTASNYNVKITNEDETTVVNQTTASVKTHKFENLTGNTKYKVFVQTVCSATEISNWSSAFEVQTNCSVVDAISKKFDRNSKPFEGCWNFVENTGEVRIWNNDIKIKKDAIFISPELNNITDKKHKFRFSIEGMQSGSTAKIEVGVIKAPFSNSTFKKVGEVEYQYNSDDKDLVVFFDEQALTDANVTDETFIAIRNVGTSDYVYVNNFNWEEALAKPDCTTISSPDGNITEIELTQKIEWNRNFDAKGYKIEVKKEGVNLFTKDVNNVLEYNFKDGELEYNTDYVINIIAYADEDSDCVNSVISVNTITSPNYGGGDKNTHNGGYFFANSIADDTKTDVKESFNWIDPELENHTQLTEGDMDKPANSFYTTKKRYQLTSTDLKGFEFEFFDEKVTNFYINANGALYFTEPGSYDNGSDDGVINDSSNQDDSFIAAVYSKYKFGVDSKIYYHSDGEKLIITWFKMEYYHDSDQVITFQLILDKNDNKIKIQLNATESNITEIINASGSFSLAGSVIGIHSGTKAKGTLYKGVGKNGIQENINGKGPLFNGSSDLAIVFKKEKDNTATVTNIENINFNIYPNPVKSKLNIVTLYEIKQVSIFDVTGKLVLTSTNKNIAVDSLPQGIFIIKVITKDNKILTHKIIKE